ncbi:hypothetical protein ACJ73_06811 [Blastomyces percursus]|uniref:Uncharacterized protein n=1 Tax=Blastomyces percursus TaxID=1658174 RepID=A0A1J9R1C0_9EURO|nr:hypothetical protein ACJ73_06811 [Blastomyces percursus]
MTLGMQRSSLRALEYRSAARMFTTAILTGKVSNYALRRITDLLRKVKTKWREIPAVCPPGCLYTPLHGAYLHYDDRRLGNGTIRAEDRLGPYPDNAPPNSPALAVERLSNPMALPGRRGQSSVRRDMTQRERIGVTSYVQKVVVANAGFQN